MSTIADRITAELGNAMSHELQIRLIGHDLTVTCSCLLTRDGSAWHREAIEIRSVFPYREALQAYRNWHHDRGIEVSSRAARPAVD